MFIQKDFKQMLNTCTRVYVCTQHTCACVCMTVCARYTGHMLFIKSAHRCARVIGRIHTYIHTLRGRERRDVCIYGNSGSCSMRYSSFAFFVQRSFGLIRLLSCSELVFTSNRYTFMYKCGRTCAREQASLSNCCCRVFLEFYDFNFCVWPY